MSPGKMASQTGHAFTGALHLAHRVCAEEAHAYSRLEPGTKIVLCAPSLDALMLAHERALARGLPAVLITDRGHVHPPDFDGSPIITALGLGPATRKDIRQVTDVFALIP